MKNAKRKNLANFNKKLPLNLPLIDKLDIQKIIIYTPSNHHFSLNKGKKISYNKWAVKKKFLQNVYIYLEDDTFMQFGVIIKNNSNKENSYLTTNMYLFKGALIFAPIIGSEGLLINCKNKCEIKPKLHVFSNHLNDYLKDEHANDNLIFFLENVPGYIRVKGGEKVGDETWRILNTNLDKLTFKIKNELKEEIQINLIASIFLKQLGISISSSTSLTLKPNKENELTKKEKLKVAKKYKKTVIEEQIKKKINYNREVSLIVFTNIPTDSCLSKGYNSGQNWLLMGNDVKDLKLRTFNLNLNKLKLNFKIYYFNSNGKIDETHENVEIEFKNPPKKDLIMAKCKDCVNRYSCPILSSILKDDPKLIYELEEYKFK